MNVDIDASSVQLVVLHPLREVHQHTGHRWPARNNGQAARRLATVRVWESRYRRRNRSLSLSRPERQGSRQRSSSSSTGHRVSYSS